jgi:hypothetical protein
MRLRHLVLLTTAIVFYSCASLQTYPGQRLNLDGMGMLADEDGDTGWECGVTEDECSMYVRSAKDFTYTADTFTAETGSTIAAQAITMTELDVTGDITLENDEMIDNSTDDIVCFEGSGGTSDEDLCLDLDGTNVVDIVTNTGVLTVDFGTIIVETAQIDANGTSTLTLLVNGEDVVLTGTSDLVTFSSSTSATMAFTPAVGFTGDITASGAAGALTFSDTASSIVLPDNDTTALDIGAAGETAMMRFNTADDNEWVEFRSPSTVSGVYDALAVGASKAFGTMALGGAVVAGTAGAVSQAHTGGGNIFNYIAIGDNQASDITMTANGIDIAGDQADNEGNEIFTGMGGASGRPLVVGTDGAFYFKVGFQVGDIDGTDTVFCGLRLVEGHQADYTSYNTYFGIGANTSADPMALKVIEELNGAAGAQTDTTDTLQDGIELITVIYVGAAGAATLWHDAADGSTLVLEDAAGVAFTFDDGDALAPVCTYLEHNAGGLADTFEITHWEIGYGTAS